MSPTGSPDYGVHPVNSSVSPTYDQGDVANRLLMGGGNVSRSGRVFWATGFEGGPSEADYRIVGTNARIETSPLVAWQGNYFLYMQTQAVLNDETRLEKYFLAAQSPGKWGLEAMFGTNSLNSEVRFHMVDSSPTANGSAAAVKIITGASVSDVKLQYRKSDGVTWETIDDLGKNFAISTHVFHNIKMVVDFQNKILVRVFLDGTVYEMNTPLYVNPVPATDKRNNFQLINKTLTAGVASASFDNVILTADEP